MYDIDTSNKEGARALNKVFKISKKYLTHIQNSVFEGELSESQIKKLEVELKRYIRKEIDSVILFESRHERWLKKRFWGKEDDATSNFI